MSDYAYLTYWLDPFGVTEPKLVLSNDLRETADVTIRDFIQCGAKVVTFDVNKLIRGLKTSGIQQLPQSLIEAGDGLKLLSGTSRDDCGEPFWSLPQALIRYFENIKDCTAFEALVTARVQPPAQTELVRLLSEASLALGGLWKDLMRDLQSKAEEQRFTEIEIPTQQIFFNRQLKGIRLDTAIAQEILEGARHEKYKAFKMLAGILGFSPSGLTFRNIGGFLAKTDASHLSEFSEQSNFRDYFNIARHSSVFADAFIRFKNAERDESVLIRTDCSAERVHPAFSCFGTVTSRILISEPRLQELSKRFRGILAADMEMRLLYLDYAQFEPAILASLSADQAFIKLFSRGDLYQSLSVAIFKSKNHRSLCKRIFLAYCYGMKLTNIAKLLAGADSSLASAVSYYDAVVRFFARFPMLETFRRNAQAQLEANGFCSSLLGNRRVRKSSGPLNAKEQRWALNQVVQGTASLIFKTALIDMAKKFGEDSILIPMHDAVLMQYNPAKSRSDQFEAAAIRVMTDSFRRWCPNVTPNVVVSAFARPSGDDAPVSRKLREQLDLPFNY